MSEKKKSVPTGLVNGVSSIPHVEPLAITEEDESRIRVRVHQLVKIFDGNVLSDSEVLPIFRVNGGLISAMDLEEAATTGPNAAFAHQS